MRTRTLQDVPRLALGFVASISVVFAAACSSSSSGTTSDRPDAGDAGDAAVSGNVLSPLADGGGTGNLNFSCGQFASLTGGAGTTCSSEETCCTVFSVATFSASATCVAKAQCTGISNECQARTDCAGGQVCCAGVASSDTAAQGGAGGFNTAALNTTCQESCATGQQQRCTGDGECPSGQTCQAAATGGLGALGGGGFGGLGRGGGDAGFMAPMTCAVPVPDGGAPDSGARASDDGGASDAGTSADAGDAASTP